MEHTLLLATVPPSTTTTEAEVGRHVCDACGLYDIFVHFGCFNIQSLYNKLDDLLEVRRDCAVDVLFLVETWHDADSVCTRRLRADGYQVIDCPRPRSRSDTLATNHRGVAAVAFTGARLERLDLGATPSTFELLCVRVSTGSSSCVVAVIYRPGSAAVSAAFYTELADVLDRLATFVDPIYVVGDLNVNVRLDRPGESSAIQLVDLLADHGLSCRVNTPTHDQGGLLDVVVTRDDLPAPSVDVVDVGLSDHRLLRWHSRPPPVYNATVVRPWRLLDRDLFRQELMSSQLCNSE